MCRPLRCDRPSSDPDSAAVRWSLSGLTADSAARHGASGSATSGVRPSRLPLALPIRLTFSEGRNDSSSGLGQGGRTSRCRQGAQRWWSGFLLFAVSLCSSFWPLASSLLFRCVDSTPPHRTPTHSLTRTSACRNTDEQRALHIRTRRTRSTRRAREEEQRQRQRRLPLLRPLPPTSLRRSATSHRVIGGADTKEGEWRAMAGRNAHARGSNGGR